MDGFQQSAVILPEKLKHLASGNVGHCDIHDKTWTVSSTSCKQVLAKMCQSFTLKLSIRTNFCSLVSRGKLRVNTILEKSHKTEKYYILNSLNLTAVDKVKIHFHLRMSFRFCKYLTMYISYHTCHIKSWCFNIHASPHFYAPMVFALKADEVKHMGILNKTFSTGRK